MKRGFTLIELLVVVLIIGILSAVALPQYTKTVKKARTAEALILLRALHDSQERYKMENGDYASSLEDLDVVIPSSTKDWDVELWGQDGIIYATNLYGKGTMEGVTMGNEYSMRYLQCKEGLGDFGSDDKKFCTSVLPCMSIGSSGAWDAYCTNWP